MSKATSDKSRMIWESVAALTKSQPHGKDTAEIDFTYENTPGKTGAKIKVRSQFKSASANDNI